MSQPAGYQRVRFIGYAIPTTPADMIAVGDPNGTGSVAGTYRAHADTSTDITARLRQLKNAVDAAVSALPDEPDPTVLTVFVAPEFYWHGQMGPYVFSHDEEDPADTILAALQAAFPVRDYPHFLFVFGSVITTRVDDIEAVFAASSTRARNDVVTALGQSWRATAGPLSLVILDMMVDFVKNCHAYPNVEVRNRALIVSGGDLNGVLDEFDTAALTTEKYYDSNEDFLLWDVTNRPVITEQMTAYPVLDLSGGDFKTGRARLEGDLPGRELRPLRTSRWRSASITRIDGCARASASIRGQSAPMASTCTSCPRAECSCTLLLSPHGQAAGRSTATGSTRWAHHSVPAPRRAARSPA